MYKLSRGHGGATSTASNQSLKVNEDLWINPGLVLGKGRHAEILEGKFQGRDVAIKRYTTIPDKEGLIQPYQDEIEALTRLGNKLHQNIVGFVCKATYLSKPLCVFERYPQSLRESLSTHEQVTVQDRMDQIIGIATGTCYLHSQQILHMDIKPANILLTTNGEPKLCDFSLSAIEPWNDFTLMFSKYCFYLAPELSDSYCSQLPAGYNPVVADSYGLGSTVFSICNEKCSAKYMWDVITDASTKEKILISRFEFISFDGVYTHKLSKKREVINDNENRSTSPFYKDSVRTKLEDNLIKPALQTDHAARILPEAFLTKAKQLKDLV